MFCIPQRTLLLLYMKVKWGKMSGYLKLSQCNTYCTSALILFHPSISRWPPFPPLSIATVFCQRSYWISAADKWSAVIKRTASKYVSACLLSDWVRREEKNKKQRKAVRLAFPFSWASEWTINSLHTHTHTRALPIHSGTLNHRKIWHLPAIVFYKESKSSSWTGV